MSPKKIVTEEERLANIERVRMKQKLYDATKPEQPDLPPNLKKREQELRDVEITEDDLRELDAMRPRTRGDCSRVPRPCPFLGCRHSLVAERGFADLHFPSCVLDVIDNIEDHAHQKAGDPATDLITLESIGSVMSLSRERVRQLLENFLRVLRRPGKAQKLESWRDFVSDYSPE